MLNVPREFLAVALLAVAAPLSAAPLVVTPAGSLEGLAQGATEAFLGVP